MATSPISPAASSAPSNYDQIAALTSEPSAPSQAESTEAQPDQAAETQPQETQPDPATESGEQAQPQAEAAAAEPEVENPYEQEETEEGFKPNALQEILRTKDGKRMLAHDKAMRALAKPPAPDGTGGLGFIPTIEEAKEHYGAYRAITLMESDLNSGNPQQAEKLLTHLFNPQRGEGPNAVAEQLIPTLAKSNPNALARMIPQLEKLEATHPDLFQQAAAPFITRYANVLWDKVMAMPNPPKIRQADGTFKVAWEGSAKEGLYQEAQAIYKEMTGEYRPLERQTQQQGSQEDSQFVIRKAELDAKQARIDEFQMQQYQTQQRQWTSAYGKTVADSLFSELDKALVPLKKMYEATPAKYERSRQFFHDKIIKDVPKNKQAWDIYLTRVANAQRTGSPEHMEAAAKEYVRLASPVIMAARKQFLEEEGAAVQSASNGRHAELRSIDSQKALNGSGSAPATPGKGPAIQRLPGESAADFNMRQLLQ